MKAILFDLDGTLTDSGEGIINSALPALKHFGIPEPDRESMRVFIGPPLRDTFVKFGVPADKAEEAIQVYRSRYMTIGKFENHPYPGIAELLAKLRQMGYHLFVATSKPEGMSVEILDKFELSQYFDIIAGASMDKSRDTKADVLRYLLDKMGAVDSVIMVGDTHFDVLGAKAHGIKTIGVTWGYGETNAMLEAGAVAIARTMDELFNLLTAEKKP